jgi:cytoskeletal protein RodZ
VPDRYSISEGKEKNMKINRLIAMSVIALLVVGTMGAVAYHVYAQGSSFQTSLQQDANVILKADDQSIAEVTETVEATDTVEPTETVEATDTIEPTDTVEPTDTAEPTETVEATETDEATETVTESNNDNNQGENQNGDQNTNGNETEGQATPTP